jgi:hypothetical protein
LVADPVFQGTGHRSGQEEANGRPTLQALTGPETDFLSEYTTLVLFTGLCYTQKNNLLLIRFS